LLRRVQEQGNPPLQDRFTDSEAPVDKYRKTSHNPPDMGLLHEYLRTTLGVPESLVPELAADIHALALARVKGEVAGRAAPVKPPLPELTAKQIQAVMKRGEKQPWSERPSYHMDAFKWVADNYKEWAGKGLLQSHLKDADPLLYNAFAKSISRKGGLPDWLDVPSETDARLRKITDPQERDNFKVVREWGRLRSRERRAALG